MSRASEARLISFPRHGSATDGLTVYQSGSDVPFPIVRAFVVNATEGDVRGKHAHKECNQLMVVLSGRCDVRCTDGAEERTHRLDRNDRGLLVPAGLWAEETYLDHTTLLLVLCDRPYEEADYIRKYDAFLQFRKNSPS